MKKDSIGEGLLLWFLFNLGVLPLFIYSICVYRDGVKAGNKTLTTFLLLFLIEIVIILVIIFIRR